MREILSLHIGQAGTQIGNSCWELFCHEHNISKDGTSMDPENNASEAMGTFFTESASGKFVPRALYLDLEPTCIEEVKRGEFKDLYHPEQMITGKEDAANNYARGHYTVGKEIIDSAMEKIRKVRLVQLHPGLCGLPCHRRRHWVWPGFPPPREAQRGLRQE